MRPALRQRSDLRTLSRVAAVIGIRKGELFDVPISSEEILAGLRWVTRQGVKIPSPAGKAASAGSGAAGKGLPPACLLRLGAGPKTNKPIVFFAGPAAASGPLSR